MENGALNTPEKTPRKRVRRNILNNFSPNEKRKKTKNEAAREFYDPDIELLSYDHQKCNDKTNLELLELANPTWGQKCKLCTDGTFVKVQPDKSHYANLVSHLAIHHPDTHRQYVKDVGSEIVEVTNQSTAAIKRLQLMQRCVELIVFKAASFELIRSEAFRGCVEDTLNLLDEAGLSLDLASHNLPELKQYISDLTLKVRKEISNEIQQTPISVMVDICNQIQSLYAWTDCTIFAQ